MFKNKVKSSRKPYQLKWQLVLNYSFTNQIVIYKMHNKPIKIII